MIDWATLQAGVVALWKSLTGLADVRWQDAQGAFVSAENAFAKAEIQVVSNVGVGALDALTWAEASPGGPMQQTTEGLRLLVLRTKVTVYDQRSALVARNYLERLRDRLPWDTSRDALEALSLGLVDVRKTQDLSKRDDQRITSIAAADVRLHLGISDTDPTEYSRVESVEVEVQEPPEG